MTTQSDWPLLSEAYDRLRAGAFAVDVLVAADEIIGRGQVPITARRSDMDMRVPERVEMLLARAVRIRTFMRHWDNEIDAGFDPETDKLWAVGCSTAIGFSDVRVRWPELVEALAAAGCGSASDPRSRRRGAYKGELANFMQRFKPQALAGLTDDQIAQRFADHVEARIKAGQSALELPQLRHVASQVGKLRAKSSGTP
jgi:hypothetical protein